MEIRVEYNSLIREIQNEFSTVYPYLKIEFYKNHVANTSSKYRMEKVKPDIPVNKLGVFYDVATINIDGKKTVAELETDFHNLLGLSVQVMRQSGNLWIQTSLTNDWTLEQQNKEGEQMSGHADQKLLTNWE